MSSDGCSTVINEEDTHMLLARQDKQWEEVSPVYDRRVNIPIYRKWETYKMKVIEDIKIAKI